MTDQSNENKPLSRMIGNKWWNLRLKHGRNCIIETPKQLLENFYEYCQWIEDNPLISIDFKGKDAIQVEIPKMRAMTKSHFAICCGVAGWDTINMYKKREGFLDVITYIEECIYNQKLTGAAAGLLDSRIISLDLNMVARSEITKSTESLSEEEIDRKIKELQQALEKNAE